MTDNSTQVELRIISERVKGYTGPGQIPQGVEVISTAAAARLADLETLKANQQRRQANLTAIQDKMAAFKQWAEEQPTEYQPQPQAESIEATATANKTSATKPVDPTLALLRSIKEAIAARQKVIAAELETLKQAQATADAAAAALTEENLAKHELPEGSARPKDGVAL